MAARRNHGVAAGKSRSCSAALVESRREVCGRLIPGYTHLQRAQPVYLAHHLLAYVEMLERDCGRLADCFDRANVCPLGSGALAGSTLPLDREMVAKLLGFVDASGHPAADAKLDGRGERPRFRRGILRRRRAAGGASFAAGGRRDSLGQRGIQFHHYRRRLHHRLVADAAKEKPGHRRTDARQEPGGSSAI